ncbi:hypothetical protein RUM43_003572 [Polyplax serrata]|uniref:PID domain-containing protein n=1 Tax=Polyplax serrata TaxID=468196 RepID=A0AAN8S6J3_POLSC
MQGELYDERTLAGAFDSEPITDTSLDEVMFRAKYLGSTLVEKPSSEEATAEAIKTILSMAKAGGRKLQRVAVSLSLNGIKVVDIPTEEIHLDVSIYSISYCSADAAHSQVFAFIATNANETLECHAFLCRKRKMAQIMSLTLARVFRTAYDLIADDFQDSSKFIIQEKKVEKDLPNEILRNEDRFEKVETALLIDFNSDLSQTRLNRWECFDESTPDKLNYGRLWDNNKNAQMDAFTGSNHFHSLLGNARWEDSRTDLLCS